MQRSQKSVATLKICDHTVHIYTLLLSLTLSSFGMWEYALGFFPLGLLTCNNVILGIVEVKLKSLRRTAIESTSAWNLCGNWVSASVNLTLSTRVLLSLSDTPFCSGCFAHVWYLLSSESYKIPWTYSLLAIHRHYPYGESSNCSWTVVLQESSIPQVY